MTTGQPPAWSIETRALVHRFGPSPALRGVDLRIAPGQRIALLGPNGAGKTTLLRILATLLRPTAGYARVAGCPLGAGPALRRRIGYAGHQKHLYADLTVEENLAFFGRLYGVVERRRRTEDVLQRCGLWGRRAERLRSLSHGQQQRAAIARALLHDPPVLLLDEPDAGLDEAGLDWLEGTISDGRRTVLLTTHTPEHGRAWCEQAIILVAGRIAFTGPATELDAAMVRNAYRAAERGDAPCPAPRDPQRSGPGTGGAGALSSPPAPPDFTLAGQAEQLWAMLQKDLRLEWRTRELLGTALAFTLLVVVTFAFALDVQSENATALAPGVLWVAFLFASVLTLTRSFALERDGGTLDGLLVAPVDRGALYLAKVAGTLVFLLVIGGALLLLLTALFDVSIVQLRLVPVLTLGAAGLAGVGTLFAAISVHTRAREVLLPLLLLPVAVPVLIGGVGATAAVLQGEDFRAWLGLLAAFDALFLVIPFWLFEYVVGD